MGLFDAVKTFATANAAVTVAFLHIEGQDPAAVTLPFTATVVKGRYRITAQQSCVVRRHIAQFRTRWPEKDGALGTVHHSDIVDANNQVLDAAYQFPYSLTAGQTMEAGFVIAGLDIPACYLRYGSATVVGGPAVQCFIKLILDVKGSPFDPEFEVPLTIIAPPGP